MCDTLVALKRATLAGETLFAKNSDRERNEAQGLELIRATEHQRGAVLRLTYIDIHQVARTHACLLSRPFWMWGAEMGANEYGVAIGNEAVHSIVPPSEAGALTGMDLVRLGLERAASAREAVAVMTELLERHGQGGDCGYREPFFYHNSFIVADPVEAFVLETVGRWWAVQCVDSVRSISNVLGVGAVDRTVSPAVQAHAEAEGWCEAGGDFDFAGRLWDPERDVATRGVERCARATDLLVRRAGSIAVADVMAVLRDHGPAAENDRHWSPSDIEGRTICMHAGHGDRRSQTVGSLVSELRADRAVHWVTGSSAPCLSLFKPVILSCGLPDQGPSPSGPADHAARWRSDEAAHRAALHDYAGAAARLRPIRDRLEAAFRQRINEAILAGLGDADLSEQVEVCWREADAARGDWARTLRIDAGATGSARKSFESWSPAL